MTNLPAELYIHKFIQYLRGTQGQGQVPGKKCIITSCRQVSHCFTIIQWKSRFYGVWDWWDVHRPFRLFHWLRGRGAVPHFQHICNIVNYIVAMLLTVCPPLVSMHALIKIRNCIAFTVVAKYV